MRPYPLPTVYKYWDQYGLLHVEPSTPCENPFLFTLEHDIWYEQVTGHRRPISEAVFKLHYDETTGIFYKSPWDLRPASRDDITAIVAASRRQGLKFHKRVKIAGRYWQPSDLLYLNWCKGGINRLLVLPFWPLIILVQAWSCWHGHEIQGPPDIATSTKILCWVRYYGAKDSWIMNLSHRINEKIIERHTELQDHDGSIVDISNWRKIFQYYLKNQSQPTRALIDGH